VGKTGIAETLIDDNVIVAGSCIAWLKAATLLDKLSKSVWVLESSLAILGLCAWLQTKKNHLDSGVYLISGCGPQGYRGGQIFHKVLQALDVEEAIQFININPFSHAYYPGINTELTQSIDAFVATLAQLFLAEQQDLNLLTRLFYSLRKSGSISCCL